MNETSLDCLFEPLQTMNLRLKNRLFMAPMGTGYDAATMIEYLVARANGDVALITTGETCVHRSGRTGLPHESTLECDDDIRPLASLASRVKKAGAAVVLQLNHAGRYSPGRKVGGQPVAPSPIMSGYTGETPRGLSTSEVEDLIVAFALAAHRAQKAGFDGVELLGSSGYLISQFLSPVTNHRTDKFGGTEINRSRFILSIVNEIRKLVGTDFNLCVKIDAEDGMEGGIGLDETKRLATALVRAGSDRLHVWAGWHESRRPMLPSFVAPAAFADLAAEIKKTVSVPVSTVGRITDPHLAAQIIRDGKADLIGIGRALLADPDFVRKVRHSRLATIRPCIGCCHCFDQVVSAVRNDDSRALTCAVNPALGREGESPIQRAATRKHIAVVGAGPTGLEAARVASLRGHHVAVYDKTDRLGGLLNLATILPHKQGLEGLIAYYTAEMRLLGVDVRLGIAYDADRFESDRPDVVVLATGARARIPAILGIDRRNVLTAFDALRNRDRTGNSVVVIGGGVTGLETAEYLALAGRDVTVIDMGAIAPDLSPTVRNGFIVRLRKSMCMLSSTRALAIHEDGVLVLDSRGRERKILADSVVVAAGLDVDRDLVSTLNSVGVEYYLAGSCKVPGLIDDAVADGFSVGCAL